MLIVNSWRLVGINILMRYVYLVSPHLIKKSIWKVWQLPEIEYISEGGVEGGQIKNESLPIHKWTNKDTLHHGFIS